MSRIIDQLLTTAKMWKREKYKTGGKAEQKPKVLALLD